MTDYKKSYKQGVETRKKKYGDDFYKNIGAKGGKNNPKKFTSESGSAAVKARWAKYHAEQANKGKEKA